MTSKSSRKPAVALVAPANARDTIFDASSFLPLYRDILEASADPERQFGPGRPSGFASPADVDPVAPYRWVPVGEYPNTLINPSMNAGIRVLRLTNGDLLVGIRAGGDMLRNLRAAQAGREQVLTLIFNGRAVFDLKFIYNGGEDWQHVPVAADVITGLLEGDPLTGCEVEKDGRTLFSSAMSYADAAPAAERVNLVRYLKTGEIEGWAKSATNPGQDLLFEASCDNSSSVCATSMQWQNDPLRKFRLPWPAPEGQLRKVELRTLDGEPGLRSPVWVFRSEVSGYVVANPRREEDALFLTLVSENRAKFRAEALQCLQTQAIYPLDQPDGEDFRYFDGRNTARLPLSALAKEPRLAVLGPGQRQITVVPPLAPLKAAIEA